MYASLNSKTNLFHSKDVKENQRGNLTEIWPLKLSMTDLVFKLVE